jgi:hypothetical protein
MIRREYIYSPNPLLFFLLSWEDFKNKKPHLSLKKWGFKSSKP